MPPEEHLRPRRFSPFWVLYLGFVLLCFGGFIGLFGSGLLPLFFGAGLTLIGVVGLGRMGSRGIQRRDQNQRGVNLLNAGEIDEAAEIFEDLAKRATFSRGHVVFVYNCAVAALLQGRVQRAMSIFNAVEASGQLRSRLLKTLEPNLYVELGSCFALTGQLDEARQYLRRAAQLLPPPEDARLLFLEAVVSVRSGDLAAASARMDEQWRRAEGSLRGPTMRTLRIVHAYTLRGLGRDATDKFRYLVAGAHPATRRDFLWATSQWPELDAFVNEHFTE